jgi:solute carrier family 41
MSMIIISKKYNINPDNVATPVAGSVGDVGTLIILALIGTFFYRYSIINILFLVDYLYL